MLLQNTGYPVRGNKRIQLNMFLKKIDEIDITQNIQTCLMPILWVDEVRKDKKFTLLNVILYL